MGSLVFPIDPWKQRLPRPWPPGRGDGRLLHILGDPCPPKIDQGGQGGQLVTDLRQQIVTYGALMVLGSRFSGGNCGVQSAVDLGGGVGAGVVAVKRRPRA